jgi:mono/diheme cytochrome c family protein
MREFLAKVLAALTAALVVALAAAFSLAQNAPSRKEARPAAAGPRAPAPAAAAAGRAAYEEHGCAGCHSITGQGNPRSPLDGVGARLARGEIRDWIVASESVRPRLAAGVARIKQGYSAIPEEELQAMVDYLAALRGN